MLEHSKGFPDSIVEKVLAPMTDLRLAITTVVDQGTVTEQVVALMAEPVLPTITLTE